MSPSDVNEVAKKIPLTVFELEVINWVEERWQINKQFPSDQDFKASWGKTVKVNQFLTHPTVRLALKNRGIRAPKSEHEMRSDLSQEQMAAILVVLDYTDKRSMYSKFKSLGINSAKWNGWMKNPVFKKYLHSISADNFGDAIHVAQTSLVKSVESGDINAIKYYMQVTGVDGANSQTMENFRIIISKLMEALTVRVADENLLRLISQDFSTILSGGSVDIAAQSAIKHQQRYIEERI